MSDPEGQDQEKNSSEEGEEERFHRRGFFRHGFRNLLKPLAEIVEKRMEDVGFPSFEEETAWESSDNAADAASGSDFSHRSVLRPPGALPEDEFLDTCLSSGQCVNVCPVSAIQFAQSGDPRLDGKPFIDPNSQACVVCDDLSCMQVCPSGALVPVASDEIAMGTAVLKEDLCVRTMGEDCQICVDKCPLGSVAIDIPYFDGPIEIRDPGCVGCGVCEMYCPTEPKAIATVPLTGVREDRERDEPGVADEPEGDGAVHDGANPPYDGDRPGEEDPLAPDSFEPMH